MANGKSKLGAGILSTLLYNQGTGLVSANIVPSAGDNSSNLATTGFATNLNAGVVSVSVAGGSNVTLTATQAGTGIILLTGAITANINVIVPTVFAAQVVNNTTGSYIITVKTSAGTGVVVSQGSKARLYSDGANVYYAGGDVATATLPTQAVNFGQMTSAIGSVRGARSGLSISYTGTSGVVTVTANELVVENSSNQYVTLRNVNLTATSGNASGVAGSLDTDSWAYSTFYNLFVIYNSTTSTSNLLWSINSTPTLPSGYTYWARIGANKIQSASNYWFLGGLQIDKNFQYIVAAGTNVTTVPVMGYGVAGSVSIPTYAANGVSPFVPSTACCIDVGVWETSGGYAALVAPNPSYGNYGSSNCPPIMIVSQTGSHASAKVRMVLESSNIYWASQSNGYLLCYGWEDKL